MAAHHRGWRATHFRSSADHYHHPKTTDMIINTVGRGRNLPSQVYENTFIPKQH